MQQEKPPYKNGMVVIILNFNSNKMQAKKFSLVDFQGGKKLSRDEMKTVMGGTEKSIAPVGCGVQICKSDSDCAIQCGTCQRMGLDLWCSN